MRGLLVALGFLTRLPVPARLFGDTRTQAASLAWYPAVGLILGGLLGGLAWWLHGHPPLLCAAIVLTAWVALTGALHLDGLADSADAWIGGLGDRERTLAIMKDPRCGPAGVVALLLLLLLKFAALASLSSGSWSALLMAPLLGRSALTVLFVTTPYVRQSGIGSALTHASRVPCLVALAISVALCLLRGWTGLLAVAVAMAVFGLWRRACVQRLGGFTGDTAGALTEMIETAVLVALALG
jgi:adenosylcobinamide-GDP ribazoletransferase